MLSNTIQRRFQAYHIKEDEELLNRMPIMFSKDNNQIMSAIPNFKEIEIVVFEMDGASSLCPDKFSEAF